MTRIDASPRATPLIRPLASGLGLREDGSFGIFDTMGNPMADDVNIVLSAGDLAQHLVNHTTAGLRIGRKLGVKAAADVGARLIQATADAATRAGAEAGLRAGSQLGVTAGAEHVIANSRIRKTVLRDDVGRISGIVEDRIPTQEGQA